MRMLDVRKVGLQVREQVLQYSPDLTFLDALEPIQEFGHRGSLLKVAEEGRERRSRASEYPGSAHFFRVALDGWALAPIDHAIIAFSYGEYILAASTSKAC